ncbi:MAG: DedA family protein [Solirubrobacteraceae bacterium]
MAAILLSGDQLHSLLGRWGYLFVFVMTALQSSGVPVPGTTALIVASLYAGSTQRLGITGVIVAAAVGATAGSGAGFALGRWGGWTLLTRYGRYVRLTPSRLMVGRYVFRQHGGKVVFFGRFITGLRTWSAFLAGANRMPLGRFATFASISAVLWALVNGLGYFWFGDALSRASTLAHVGLVLALVASLAVSALYLRRRGQGFLMAAESAYAEELNQSSKRPGFDAGAGYRG